MEIASKTLEMYESQVYEIKNEMYNLTDNVRRRRQSYQEQYIDSNGTVT
jgi:hypothetical protein